MEFEPRTLNQRSHMKLIRILDKDTEWYAIRLEFLEGLRNGIISFEFEKSSIDNYIIYKVYSFEKNNKEITKFMLPHIHVNVHRSRPEIFHVSERCSGERFSHHYGKQFVKHYEIAPEFARGWVTNNFSDNILDDFSPISESLEILRFIFLEFISYRNMYFPKEIILKKTIQESKLDMQNYIFLDNRKRRAINHRQKLLALAAE